MSLRCHGVSEKKKKSTFSNLRRLSPLGPVRRSAVRCPIMWLEARAEARCSKHQHHQEPKTSQFSENMKPARNTRPNQEIPRLLFRQWHSWPGSSGLLCAARHPDQFQLPRHVPRAPAHQGRRFCRETPFFTKVRLLAESSLPSNWLNSPISPILLVHSTFPCPLPARSL